jgi:putative Holliday junction resolvase
MNRRWLGLDLGEARIGVALSDDLTGVALPYRTLANGPAVVAEIKVLAEREQVAGIVIGLPLKLDGTRGPAAEKAAEFKKQLEQALPGKQMVFWDERLTTAQAQKALRAAGKNSRQSRKIIDQVAAQMLLQSYLDSR